MCCFRYRRINKSINMTGSDVTASMGTTFTNRLFCCSRRLVDNNSCFIFWTKLSKIMFAAVVEHCFEIKLRWNKSLEVRGLFYDNSRIPATVSRNNNDRTFVGVTSQLYQTMVRYGYAALRCSCSSSAVDVTVASHSPQSCSIYSSIFIVTCLTPGYAQPLARH